MLLTIFSIFSVIVGVQPEYLPTQLPEHLITSTTFGKYIPTDEYVHKSIGYDVYIHLGDITIYIYNKIYIYI